MQENDTGKTEDADKDCLVFELSSEPLLPCYHIQVSLTQGWVLSIKELMILSLEERRSEWRIALLCMLIMVLLSSSKIKLWILEQSPCCSCWIISLYMKSLLLFWYCCWQYPDSSDRFHHIIASPLPASIHQDHFRCHTIRVLQPSSNPRYLRTLSQALS